MVFWCLRGGRLLVDFVIVHGTRVDLGYEATLLHTQRPVTLAWWAVAVFIIYS